MNARNRVFLLLGLLTAGSLVWYLFTARPPADLKLIGTVDANRGNCQQQDSWPDSKTHGG